LVVVIRSPVLINIPVHHHPYRAEGFAPRWNRLLARAQLFFYSVSGRSIPDTVGRQLRAGNVSENELFARPSAL
jgi:hypothetical protein